MKWNGVKKNVKMENRRTEKKERNKARTENIKDRKSKMAEKDDWVGRMERERTGNGKQ